MNRRALWLGLPLLLTGCYLGTDTQSTRTESFEAGVTVDLDAGRFTADVRTDASPRTDSSIAIKLDAGCASNAACPSNLPVCSAGVCTACKQASDCSGFPSTPACASSGACVTCSGEQKSLCTGDKLACDPTTSQCVQCIANTDCSAANAVCQPDHTCGGCMKDDECSRYDAVCNDGACVECRPASEKVDCRSEPSCDPTKAECPGTACDPKLLTCTGKTRGSVTKCSACVSDSECATSYRCVDLKFGTADQGGFCLKVNTQASCNPPYAKVITASSLSGVGGSTYCGIPDTASCGAIQALDQSKRCTSGDAGVCGAPGALCKTVGAVANVCTYACNSSFDCPDYAPCMGPTGARYCGGAAQ